jgi:hypothetical protein
MANITNIALKSLEKVVTLWVAINKCSKLGDKQACILALGKNTSAIGWLYKSKLAVQIQQADTGINLLPIRSDDQAKVAGMDADRAHCLASQHIQGNQNTQSLTS